MAEKKIRGKIAERKPARPVTARQAAQEVLRAFFEEKRPVEPFLEAMAGGLPDPRDAALAHALVHGVLQQMGYLDYILSMFLKKPLPGNKKAAHAALLSGIYQLLFLDRIPVSAAINETVNLLKESHETLPLAGLANAVLRNLLRAREAGGWQPEEKMPADARLSHPRWLLDRWIGRYGREAAEAICRANNSQRPLTLRVNARATSRPDLLALFEQRGITAAAGQFCPEAVQLTGFRGSPTLLPGYDEGLFQVQDEGAQLVSHLFGPLGKGCYLDACAGLGGKTSHLAALLPEGGSLVAVDPDPRRQRLFQANFARLGLALPEFFAGTLADYAARHEGGGFFGILIDAPCSGLGVIGRHPEIRWLRQKADLVGYQRQQLALLTAAAPLLAAGGVIVYATCSTEPEENEVVVRRFLASHPDFSVAQASAVLPSSASVLVDNEGFLRILPGDHGLDGFFGARLARNR